MKIFITMLLCTIAMQSQTQAYTASTENITNPERGQYRYTTGKSVGTFNPLNQATLAGYKTNEKITLIWRAFYLDAFKTTLISADFLTKIQTDFTTMRAAGVKCILRFCYTNIDGSDATKAQMLAHIEQLKPITMANEDVISNLEAGFIGNYGEWYYSANFGTENLTAQNLADRLEIGLKIMELTPNRMVAFRTPYIQRQIGGAATVTTSTAYDKSVKSRVAGHNDCFLSSADDYGTYLYGATDYAYLENQSKYTFDGGETCSLTTYSSCSNAVAVMARYHFNYLNADYNQIVEDSWVTNGCYADIQKKLGYRIELLNSTIANNVLTVNLQNVGFGNIINERKAYLVLKNTTTGTEYPFVLATNPNFWLSGTQIQIVQNLNFDVPVGSYQLFLNLPDLQITNPAYAIQCANTGLWDAVKGYNNLNQTFTVAAPVITTTPTTTTTTTTTTPTTTTTTTTTPVLDVVITLVNNTTIVITNLPSPVYTIKVYNTSGRLKATTTDISSLRAGIYIVKVYCNGVTYSQKIVKL